MTSPAYKVLQARALQCSFSSVFHLKRTGMNPQQAAFLERVFLGAVGGPLLVLGFSGFVAINNGSQSDK
jgi:hypothetical protein